MSIFNNNVPPPPPPPPDRDFGEPSEEHGDHLCQKCLIEWLMSPVGRVIVSVAVEREAAERRKQNS